MTPRYRSYINDLRWKATLHSVLVPCIVIFNKARAFEITSLASSFLYLFGTIMGWILFETSSDFGLSRNQCNNETNNSTQSNITDPDTLWRTNSTSSGIHGHIKHDWLTFLFPVTLVLLVLSCLCLLRLLRLSIQPLKFAKNHVRKF